MSVVFCGPVGGEVLAECSGLSCRCVRGQLSEGCEAVVYFVVSWVSGLASGRGIVRFVQGCWEGNGRYGAVGAYPGTVGTVGAFGAHPAVGAYGGAFPGAYGGSGRGKGNCASQCDRRIGWVRWWGGARYDRSGGPDHT